MSDAHPNLYHPSVSELRQRASLFWPVELTAREASASIIPILMATQDKFISLLDIADARPDAWKDVLRTTAELKANVFLKHLMVLTDVGGELLKRLRPELGQLFPTGTMTYLWRGQLYDYRFKALLQSRSLDNKTLHVDGISLLQGHDLDDRMEDLTMLLLYGAAVSESALPEPIREKCVVGGLIGRTEELARFVKQRYIFVSKITSGATSNALGQLAQSYVRDTLANALPDWQIGSNRTIPSISQNAGKTDINFDIVAQSPHGKYTAIEVSFQVTTNSVIERKAGQAQARAEILHQAGYRIAYVLDGAGNFERAAALQTLCQYSDCTVALTETDLNILVEFLREG